jgi:p-aminobenzoyl-glutamate transporter AbgT
MRNLRRSAAAVLMIGVMAILLTSCKTDGDLQSTVNEPKNNLMTMLQALGSLLIVWFIFRQMLQSFTVSRLGSAGLVAGFCVFLVNGGLLTIIGMLGEQLEPLGTPDTWF